MEKRQCELCLEILRRFNKTGILRDFILIGSWSAYFYKEYFSGTPYLDRAALKTRDIDFLIDNPAKIKHEGLNKSEDKGILATLLNLETR